MEKEHEKIGRKLDAIINFFFITTRVRELKKTIVLTSS